MGRSLRGPALAGRTALAGLFARFLVTVFTDRSATTFEVAIREDFFREGFTGVAMIQVYLGRFS